MGKGDQKTRRGKLFRGSYGVRRPRKKLRGFSIVSTTKKSVTKSPGKVQAPEAPKGEPVNVQPEGSKAAPPQKTDIETVKSEMEVVKATTQEKTEEPAQKEAVADKKEKAAPRKAAGKAPESENKKKAKADQPAEDAGEAKAEA